MSDETSAEMVNPKICLSLIEKLEALRVSLDTTCGEARGVAMAMTVVEQHTAMPDYHAATTTYARLAFDKDGKTIEWNIYDLIKQVVDAAMRVDQAEELPGLGQQVQILPTPTQTSEISANRLFQALIANDVMIRNMRHRDARWHDDELVKQLLAENTKLIQENSAAPKPVSVSLEKCSDKTGLPYCDIIRVLNAAGVAYVD